MEAILEMLWNIAPRLFACILFTLAAILFVAWLVPSSDGKSLTLVCVGATGLIVGIFWEVYARRKKSH
jgi:VIT1/CCC1 family predicted Fe2+/Mn2+ transporter